MNMYKIVNLTEYKDLLLNYCNLLSNSSIQRLLQKNKSSFSIIEKIIYDIAKFELNKKNMNIDDDELYITFFCKNKLSNNLNELGFHTDIDDYEYRIKNTITLSPIISSILYLNESSNPVFMTNIEKYKKDFDKINKNFSLVFPSEFLNISFNGGKYYHSECNIFMENNAEKKRDVIVILVWDKCPKHVPIYDDHSFLYEISWKYSNIDLDNYSMNYEKEKNLLIFKNCEQKILKISDKIINNVFYEELFKNNDNMFKLLIPYLNEYNKHKNLLFIVSEEEELGEEKMGEIKELNQQEIDELKEELKEQEEKQANYNTYNEIEKTNNEEETQPIQFTIYDENKTNIQEELTNEESINNILGCNLNKWEIDFGNEEETKEHLGILLNDCKSSDLLEYVYLLDHSKPNLDIIEKYIYDIVEFHLSNMNKKLDDNIFVEFWFRTYSKYNMHVDSDDIRVNKNNTSPRPFLSCITYLNDNESPTVFTNISLDSYKLKKIEENNSLIFYFPKKLNHIVFDGANYFHSKCNLFNNKYELNDRNTLLINIWNTKPMDIQYYDSTLRNTFFDGNQYRIYSYNKHKVLPIINFKNQNYKYKIYETNKNVLSKDFFEEILYKKKDDNIFNNFNTFFENYKETGHNVFVLREKKIENNKNKFNTPVHIDYSKMNLSKKILTNKEKNILIKGFIEINTCNDIIEEYINYIKKNNFNMNETIDCENLENSFEIIIKKYFVTLLETISKELSINETLNVKKILVSNKINNNEQKIYNESIVANILLSKSSIFIDNKQINQGDLFVSYNDNTFNLFDLNCYMLEIIIEHIL